MKEIKGGFLKAEQIYNRSKCNGIFTSKALMEILESPNFSSLLEQTKRSIETAGTPDPILTRVLEELGFNALPIMVDSSHYELLVKSGLTPVYRGVRKDDGIVDFATNPKMFVGKGIFCNGVYFAYEKQGAEIDPERATAVSIAERYMIKPKHVNNEHVNKHMNSYNQGQVICALVSENARIIELKELLKLNNMVKQGVRTNADISAETKQKMLDLLSREASVVAALEGVDIIKAGHAKFMIVLNRGALIMDKDAVEKSK